jgi:hypothetical protein
VRASPLSIWRGAGGEDGEALGVRMDISQRKGSSLQDLGERTGLSVDSASLHLRLIKRCPCGTFYACDHLKCTQTKGTFSETIDIYIQAINIYILTMDIYIQAMDIYIQAIDIYILTMDIYIQAIDIYIQAIDIYIQAIDIYICTSKICLFSISGDFFNQYQLCPLYGVLLWS